MAKSPEELERELRASAERMVAVQENARKFREARQAPEPQTERRPANAGERASIRGPEPNR